MTGSIRALQWNQAMKHREKTSTWSGSPKATNVPEKKIPKKPAQDEPRAVDDSAREIHRPGFDLDGSSGDTHAGTGLGLGNDAFDKPGERRLPGRRPDNKLTIPRWGGPESRVTDGSRKKLSVLQIPSAPQPKRGS